MMTVIEDVAGDRLVISTTPDGEVRLEAEYTEGGQVVDLVFDAASLKKLRRQLKKIAKAQQ